MLQTSNPQLSAISRFLESSLSTKPGNTEDLTQCFNLADVQPIAELTEVLFNPVRDLVSGQSKKVRSGLIFASAGLCNSTLAKTASLQGSCRALAELLENLHAGSLVIDDIQDRAEFRRGNPALHVKLGVPLAINAGNWLYFHALNFLPKAQLPPQQELKIHRLCHQTLFDGHIGQALDVGVRIDQVEQTRVGLICESAMMLKSGALMSLASQMGAVVAGASESVQQFFGDFGTRFGCALQMFNDLKEFSTANEATNRDLFLHRPSWIWAVAARELSPSRYEELRLLSYSCLSPESENLPKLVGRVKSLNLVAQAHVLAEQKMQACLTQLALDLDSHQIDYYNREEWLDILQLAKRVRSSSG
jgi:geranylgeranyl pyrophosphate synthase